MGVVPLISCSGIEIPRANHVRCLRLLLVRCPWVLSPPAFVSFAAVVADGTTTPFPFFHECHVCGLNLILLVSLACWLDNVQIVKVGFEPFSRQDIGLVLLLPEQVVVVQLLHDGLEPFFVCQEEVESHKVLLAADLHCLF